MRIEFNLPAQGPLRHVAGGWLLVTLFALVALLGLAT